MPAYDFRCKSCDRTIEVTRHARDETPVLCPGCGQQMKQVFHPTGVHFKGSGFHNTDYRTPERHPEGGCEAAGSTGACEGCPAAE